MKLFLVSLLLAALLSPLSAAIIHVDENADAGGDGSSWDEAYIYLQSALGVAVSGDEIWITQGSYYPDQTPGVDTNSTAATFSLISGVEIYGGFVGTETLRDERAPNHYRTILNGDVGPNVDIVVTVDGADATAILDGVTIAYGKQGLRCTGGGAAQIINCRFLSNADAFGSGGGVRNQASLTLRGCSFVGNRAWIGGGIYSSSSGITIENCSFLGNSAKLRGGAVLIQSSNATLTACSFHGNYVDGSETDGDVPGGGGLAVKNGNATLSHCVIWENFAVIKLAGGDSIAFGIGGAATYSYCLIEDFDLTGVGTGNYDGTDPLNDPLFTTTITPSDSPQTEGNLTLRPGSPLLEAGNSSTGSVDADGNPRVSDGDLNGVATVDIGAHERPQRVFVDADASGTGDGSSWSDAFPTVQDALAISVTPLEIWVAEGTYYPDEGGAAIDNDRNSSFVLANDQHLLGGFAGDEAEPEARVFGAHPSILSGDLLQDDSSTGNADNSYHVVTITSTDASAALSGFTISGGNANASFPHSSGGGLTSSTGGSTRIAHCEFLNNDAVIGGAMFLDASSPVISDSTFSNNNASIGGALRVENGANPTLARCSFTANTASSGGAISSDASSPAFTDCFINGNLAQQDGGAFAINAGTPSLTGCELKGNRANQDGGVFFNVNASPILLNCTLQGNSAGGNGGAIANDNSAPALTNTLIWNNEANGATTGPDASVSNTNASAPTYNYSLAEHLDLTGSGTGNLDGSLLANDPHFMIPADPASAPSVDGDLRLRPISSAIDAGDNTANTLLDDLEGRTRIIDGDYDGSADIDLGAYERPTTIYVDSNRFRTGGAEDGSSWPDAYIDLQDALVAANPDSEIWIADGTYHPDDGGGQTDRDRNATFTLERRVALYGGFEGHEIDIAERDPATPPTILSGDLRQNDDTVGTDDNSFRVVTANRVDPSCLLDGLTITAGIGNGGALNIVNDAAPTVTNCRFIGNYGNSGTGAVSINLFNEGPSTLVNQRAVPTFQGVTFADNTAGSAVRIETGSLLLEPICFTDCEFSNNQGGSGAAVLVFGLGHLSFLDCTFTDNSGSNGGAVSLTSSPGPDRRHLFKGCSFIGNSATNSGGGLYVISSPALIEDCLFRGNHADQAGGGLYSNNNALTCINSLFQGNRADGTNTFVNGGGGGAYIQGGSFINCSFQGNRAVANNGGGLTAALNSSTQLTNCVFWNNEANGSTATATASIYAFIATPAYTHCLLQNIDLTGVGVGNLDGTLPANDPLFLLETDPSLAPTTTGDLRLRSGSAAIDAGLDTANPLPTDLAGSPRILGGAIDLGAHETLSTPEITVADSNGNPLTSGSAIIDLGLLRLEDLTELIDLTVTNLGIPILTTGSVTPSGVSAPNLSVSTPLPGSIVSYTPEPLQLALALTSGAIDLSIAIVNGDADEDPFLISFTGTVASDVNDADSDGLSDYAELGFGTDPNLFDSDSDGASDRSEFNLAALGFINGQDDTLLVTLIQGGASGIDLFTESQLQALALSNPTISRDPVTGKFTLTLDAKKSLDLSTFTDFDLTPHTVTVNGDGNLEITFTSGDDAAFFQLEFEE